MAGQNGAFVADVDGDVGSPGKVIVAPEFLRAVYHPNASFNMRISTLPNLNYVIEYKNTLVDPDWAVLTSFTATSNSFFLRDSTVGTNASRFYRISVTTP